MRGIRYISFPPIVFETAAPEALPVAPEVLPEPVPASKPDALPRRRLAEFAAAAEEEATPPPRLRRLAELTAADTLGPDRKSVV